MYFRKSIKRCLCIVLSIAVLATIVGCASSGEENEEEILSDKENDEILPVNERIELYGLVEKEDPEWMKYDYSSMSEKCTLKNIELNGQSFDQWSLDDLKSLSENDYNEMIEDETSNIYDRSYDMGETFGKFNNRTCCINLVHEFSDRQESTNKERIDADYYYYQFWYHSEYDIYESLDELFERCGKPDYVLYEFTKQNSMDEVDYFAYQYENVTLLFKYYGKLWIGIDDPFISAVDEIQGFYIIPNKTFDQLIGYIVPSNCTKVEL